MAIDFILNGKATGDVATTLLNHGMDPNALRPYIGDDGNSYITRNTGRYNADGSREQQAVLTNNPAALRFQDWRLIDEAIIKVAKPPLVAIGDLRSRGLDVQLKDGLGVTVFSYENSSDISAANISMNGIVKQESDRPVFNIINLPIPIIHKDFSFDIRQIEASRRGYSPLDLFAAELAAERVAEAAESLLLGVLPSYAYAGASVYGYTNFPNRLTKTLTAPGSGGWTPNTTVLEVLAMRQQLNNAYHYGPYMLYCSNNWDSFMDEDYSSAKGDNTLRTRIAQTPGIEGVVTVPWLQFLTGNPYTLLMVEMKPRTIREIIACDITTMQWESHGGWMMNFKVLCSMTPQLRADQNLNCGINHGSVASS